MDKFKHLGRDKELDLKTMRDQGDSFEKTNGKEQNREFIRFNVDIDKKSSKDRSVETKNMALKDPKKQETGDVIRDSGDSDKPVIKSNDFKNIKLRDLRYGIENKRVIEHINHIREKKVKTVLNFKNLNKTNDLKVIRKDVNIGNDILCTNFHN